MNFVVRRKDQAKLVANRAADQAEVRRLDDAHQKEIAALKQRDAIRTREVAALRRQQQQSAREFHFLKTVAAIAGMLLLVMASFIVGVVLMGGM